jgi:ribosomal protein S18 acetylase RimI-like enzyme
MEIKIKPLMPELASDFLDFFDHRAFAPGDPNGPCYCNAPTMDNASLRKMVGEFGNDCKGVLRGNAEKQLARGEIRGYLAFDGDTSVGWCNAGDMDAYAVNDYQFVPDAARHNACGKTISVVCFEVAPEYRGRGVASALLARVVADAAAKGYAAVEGYAPLQKAPSIEDFHGPVRLYEKAGFREVARLKDRVVMRKTLSIRLPEQPENQWIVETDLRDQSDKSVQNR